MLGHYLKIISFYLIYLSLVREGIRNPVQLFYSELQKTARDLRESNNTKNRIFSIIAHDLKNSFNSTIGITNLMLSNSQRHDMSSQENLELIAMINSSAKSTYELLENLLVTVDSNMIYTVLRNLLDNAIKYTWRGGTVTIRITANRSLARIEIEDSGIGMSSEEIKQGHL
ncbi:ATP-binding protein [Marispirochaeta sp.]|uniref:sensor histidine kinase n=1 Tax=Marispirochaeta sp. TaxID=2038653 RepID=UPI0029C764CD|nr:ATP-binding protein [Marispirochaeta sp.]